MCPFFFFNFTVYAEKCLRHEGRKGGYASPPNILYNVLLLPPATFTSSLSEWDTRSAQKSPIFPTTQFSSSLPLSPLFYPFFPLFFILPPYFPLPPPLIAPPSNRVNRLRCETLIITYWPTQVSLQSKKKIQYTRYDLRLQIIKINPKFRHSVSLSF